MNDKATIIDKANSPGAVLFYRLGTGVFMSVVLWFGSDYIKHREIHAENDKALAVALANIDNTLQALQGATADLYTSRDAVRDLNVMDVRMTSLEDHQSGQIRDIKDTVRSLLDRLRDLEIKG